jgi:capsular polysaccharide transport system permease protein
MADPATAPATRREPTLGRGLRIQGNVIGALILRELHTRYGRENIGVIWLVLEPMLLAVAIALIHSRAPNHFGTDMKPVPFTLLGYCNFIMFRGIINRSEGALEANLTLLYHRTVTILDVVLSRALLEAAGTIFAFALLMGLAVATGMANPPERPFYLVVGILSLFALCLSWSTCVVAITHDRRAAGRLIHPITYIMLPLSGAFWAMQWLPRVLTDAFQWVPLVSIFELIRYGWFRSAEPTYVFPAYVAAWIVGPLLLGLLGLKVMRSRIHMS